MSQKDQSTSILNSFEIFFKDHSSHYFQIMDLIDTLGKRSFGVILLLMALPNVLLIASIPGLSTIFGTIMALVSIQMILRLPKIWLPKNLKGKSYEIKHFQKIVNASRPFLISIEPFLKPRLLGLTATFLEPLLGIVSFINSVWITLPIPFGNFFPGVAVVVLSLGIIQNDGLFIIAGIALSLLVWSALLFMYSVLISQFLHFIG